MTIFCDICGGEIETSEEIGERLTARADGRRADICTECQKLKVEDMKPRMLINLTYRSESVTTTPESEEVNHGP